MYIVLLYEYNAAVIIYGSALSSGKEVKAI